MGVLLVANLAPAPGSMVFRHTNGTVTAGQGRAGVDTDRVLASQLSGTIFIRLALRLGGRAFAALQVRVTPGALGTLALVAARLIQTPGARPAHILSTLIHILTAIQRISSIASFTQTLGRVGGRALSVDSALEPLARTFTLAAVSCVGKVGRGTDTLARFHALFI